MKNWIIGLLLLCIAGIAQAAPTCVVKLPGVPSASISFVAPTLNTDGSSIKSPITYNIWQSTTSGTEVKSITGITGSPAVVTIGLKGGTTYFFTVSVTSPDGESIQSNEGCVTFPAGLPNTVTITIS